MAAKLVWILVSGFALVQSLGNVATIEEYPSIAQVEVYNGEVWVQHCVASVLTNRHVLSAASCFSGALYRLKNRRVRAGSSYRGVGGVVLGLEALEIHPSFGLLGQEADLAVVKLDNYLTLSSEIQQVPILGQGIELPFGLKVLVSGWGDTMRTREPSDGDLYSLGLKVHDNENCMIKYFGSQIVTENMVCAGLTYTQGRDFYSTDLGAPLLYSNTLVGILIFGEKADDEMPLVATNVGSYTEWIVATASSL